MLGAVTRPSRSNLPLAGRLLIKFVISYMIGHLVGDWIEDYLKSGLGKVLHVSETSSKLRRVVHLVCKAAAVILGNWLGNELSDIVDSHMSRNRAPRDVRGELRAHQRTLPGTAAAVAKKFLPRTLAAKFLGQSMGPRRRAEAIAKTGYGLPAPAKASAYSRAPAGPGRPVRRSIAAGTASRHGDSVVAMARSRSTQVARRSAR